MADNSLVLQAIPYRSFPRRQESSPHSVIPAQVEIQQPALNTSTLLDSRLRGNDGMK